MHIAIMPEKQPKRPNNNAKALESWESEGGACFALAHAAIREPAPAYNCGEPVVRYCIAGYSYPEVWCLRTRT
jgi:hypothetical protein